MMITMPSQSSLSELGTLLQLLQAASDPKKSQAAIDLLSAERKKYDDAIAESMTKVEQARIAVAEADAAQRKAEAAEAKAQAKLDKLDERKQEVDGMAASAKDSQDSIRAQYADLEAKVAASQSDHQGRMALLAAESARLSKISADMDARSVGLEEAIAASNAAKAEYEDKLAKLKALAI